MGVTVTFLAILELLKEHLVSVVQAEAFGPIHIRAGADAASMRPARKNHRKIAQEAGAEEL